MENSDNFQISKQQTQNGRARRGAFVFWLVMGTALAGLDQATKYLAFLHGTSAGSGFGVWHENFFNAWFAFSLPLPGLAMAVIYALVLSGFVWYVAANGRKFSFCQKLGATLILAGGFSNVAERLVMGGVRDFVAIGFANLVGYYNLADFYIIAGIILFLIISMLPKRFNVP